MTIELTTIALFLFSTFYGSAPANVKTEAISKLNIENVRAEMVNQPITLEAYVREYYKDIPVLAEIAKCESQFRHLGVSGKVLRGEVAKEDLGVMQINEFYHEDPARALGIDLHTLDGNLAYAKWLYNKEGTTPWYSSSKCWQRSDAIAKANGPMAKIN